MTKRHLPFALTTLRLLLSPTALACALTDVPRWIYLPILATATLSDIYDGILARRFGVATPALRRYDSITDVIYYLFILVVAWWMCKPVLAQRQIRRAHQIRSHSRAAPRPSLNAHTTRLWPRRQSPQAKRP
jgi:hypothetical protein